MFIKEKNWKINSGLQKSRTINECWFPNLLTFILIPTFTH